jgi:hypothetical protein
MLLGLCTLLIFVRPASNPRPPIRLRRTMIERAMTEAAVTEAALKSASCWPTNMTLSALRYLEDIWLGPSLQYRPERSLALKTYSTIASMAVWLIFLVETTYVQ